MEQWGPGLGGAWRRRKSRQAIAVTPLPAGCSVRQAVWTILPGGGSKLCDFLGTQRLAIRVPRQAVWKQIGA